MPKRAASPSSNNSSHDRLEPKLLRAVEANDIPRVTEIIDEAQTTRHYDEKFLTFGLTRACDKNLWQAARFLLSRGANPNHVPVNKQPSLLRAAEHGHVEITEALIDYRVNLEVCDKKGRTALMTAAWKGQFETVKLLLTRGADIHTLDLRKRNVLHNLAADRGDERNADTSRDNNRGRSGMDVVDYLLQAGINLDARDELGRTALHWTSVTGNELLMRRLLRTRLHGAAPRAEVHVVDSRMKTPLHLAVSHRRENLVSLLLANGANVHAESDGGWTALHNASGKEGTLALLNILLDAGADVNRELLNGRTPLHIAAESGNQDATRSLLAQPSVKRAVRDRFGNTPLLIAAQNGQREIAEMLAPWNHVSVLSPFEIEASKHFNATIVDFGNYRNENKVTRRSVYDLLYARDPKDNTKHAVSTLPQNVKASRFRWIHLPANNIAWCDTLMTKHFIEDGARDVEAYKTLESSFSHQHRGLQHHSRFMRPMCQIVQRAATADEPTTTEEASTPKIVLSAPDPKPSTPPALPKVNASAATSPGKAKEMSGLHAPSATQPESPRENKAKPKPSGNNEHASDKSAKKNKSQPSGRQSRTREKPSASPARKGPGSSAYNIYMFMPYLHFETDTRRREMQEAMEHADRLHLRRAMTEDEMLIRAHLTASSSFLHVRRTLDQFFYHNIDTHTRDSDQVVYRYQLKHTDSSDPDPKIFMVDQLWMWVLGKDLVVTSFPQRWRQPRNDPLNVLEGIIEDINSKTREPVQNVYELAMTISGRCFGTFDRHRKGDSEYQFLDMFEASIGNAMDNEAVLFQDFSKASGQASEWLLHHSRPNKFSKDLEADEKAREAAAAKVRTDAFLDEDHDHLHEPRFVDKLLDVGSETDLLAEIKDIRDELDIIRMVLDHQEHLLPELKNAIRTIYQDERSSLQTRKVDKSFEEQEKTITNPLKDINRMDKQAERIYTSIRDLLDLKQKHANAFEARFARDQAAGTVRQGQTIMVFTVVTVIFLPLSFIAAFFAINIEQFPHASDGTQEMSLHYVSGWTFGIGLAISVPCIMVALSVDELAYYYKKLRRRTRAFWLKWQRRQPKDDGIEHQLQGIKIEQALSTAKSMRRSMEHNWNGRAILPPRKSIDYPKADVYNRRRLPRHDLDIESGR